MQIFHSFCLWVLDISFETSEAIVSRLHKAYPKLENNIIVGSFTETLLGGEFDLKFDRGALICNKTDAVQVCLQRC